MVKKTLNTRLWLLVSLILVLLGLLVWYFFLNNNRLGNKTATLNNQTNEQGLSQNKTTIAIEILGRIPEIKTIQDAVVKAGRKIFFIPEDEEGDIVTISLRESFPDDSHTTSIDTFKVNVKTGVVTVVDIISDSDISLEEWIRTIEERFR